MIGSLEALLDRGNIILHDEHTIDELRTFVKHVKKRIDGTTAIKMEAKKGHHDDDVAALWIYAGSLDIRQLEGKHKSGFAII